MLGLHFSSSYFDVQYEKKHIDSKLQSFSKYMENILNTMISTNKRMILTKESEAIDHTLLKKVWISNL